MPARTRAVDRRLGEILLETVRGEAWRQPSSTLGRLVVGADLRKLPDAASHHHIDGYVRSALRLLPGIDPAVRQRLDEQHLASLATHLRAVHQLGQLPALLDGIGPWMVVKGPILSEVMHPRPGLRTYGDLDVVVPGACLAEAIAAFEEDGAEILVADWWPQGRRRLSGEIHVLTKLGVVIDLHWHLLNSARERAAFAVPMAEAFHNARTVTLHGHPVRTLDEADTLLHLALHGCVSGGNRLVWLKDIERCIAHDAPDWDTVIVRARRWRVALVVATMLAKTRRVLSAPVPEDVLRALVPNHVWERLSSFATMVAPLHLQAHERGSFDRMVTRATRRDLQSSGRELARRATNWALSCLPVRIEQPVTAPGHEGRRSFLDAVGRASGL